MFAFVSDHWVLGLICLALLALIVLPLIGTCRRVDRPLFTFLDDRAKTEDDV